MSQTLTLAGNGLNVEYERVGSGPVLVYLHGAFGLQWSMPLVQALAKHHTVVAPHMPGYGRSEGLERIGSFYDLSVWLDEVLDALKLDQVAIAGHDFGGAAAAEYAALYRRRIERVVLLAPYGLWPQQGEPLTDIFALTPGALTRVLYADPTGAHANDFNVQYPDKAQQDEAILARRQALIAAAKLMWPIPDKGLRRRLYRITVPTLLIGARQDAILPESYMKDFASAIAGARLVMVQAGHMLPQEATAEVTHEICGFLQHATA